MPFLAVELDAVNAAPDTSPQTTCNQCGCGGHVCPAEAGLGRCRRCAVVMRWGLGGWRRLTAAEWDRAPESLASIRPWTWRGRN